MTKEVNIQLFMSIMNISALKQMSMLKTNEPLLVLTITKKRRL